MSDKILNIGLAGCGHLGKIHARLLNDLASGGSIHFKGIFDADKSITSAIAGEYNITGYNSLAEMLDEIDALVIVTPTSTHFEIAKEAITKGIHLFIEKPVTSSLAEAEELEKLAVEKNGLKIQVGHVERFNPALVALAKYDVKPMFIESHRLSQFNPRGTDVSVIQDLMIHDIDIILHLAQSPVVKIDANGVAVISDEIDIANARLTLANGCVANLTSSRISLKKMRKMRIFQNNAYISVDFLNNKSEVFRLTGTDEPDSGMTFPVSDTKKIIYTEPRPENAESINPIKNELESFINSISDNSPVKVTLSEGKEAVKTADKILEIIRNNK